MVEYTITITEGENGLLSLSPRCIPAFGYQFDDKEQVLKFERPSNKASAQLVLIFNNDQQGFEEENIGTSNR